MTENVSKWFLLNLISKGLQDLDSCVVRDRFLFCLVSYKEVDEIFCYSLK